MRAPLVVASDVHLRHMDDDRGCLLLEVLNRIAPGEIEVFVLNGDIFDFCFGGSAFFQKKFAALGSALGRLANGGTRVLFVEGNHEFHIDAMGWQGVEFVKNKDIVVELRGGERIKITHGDLIKDDFAYRVFRGFLKSSFLRWLVGLIPGRWLDAYALRHAQFSRSRDDYRKLDHPNLMKLFDRWLAAGDCEHGIFGHFHVPYAERRSSGPGYFVSVESWDKPNLLVFKGGRFYRVFLQPGDRPWLLEPAEPLFS